MKIKITILIGILFFIAGIVDVDGQSFASSVTHQVRPSFQAIYGPEGRIETYWPILGNKETCEARQDFLLQISPIGCQPAVVRSDLLAEQNVPVFCQIDALQLNPLIDVKQIRSIRFRNNYPQGIVGVGFHPARAALRSRDKLLGSPLINNIGYVVVVLRRNEVEKNVPDFVNLSLNAQIDYEADNVFGVGKAEFILEPMSDEQWEKEKFKQSFWKGRYFVRLEDADANFATVNLYSGDRKTGGQKIISSVRVKKGETSRPVYVPGAYCRAGIQVAYDGFKGAEDMGVIEISDGENIDRLDVYKGSRFLNDKCVVNDIIIGVNNDTGNVSISCGKEKLNLMFGEKGSEGKFYLSKEYDGNGIVNVYSDSARTKFVNVNFDGTFVVLYENQIGEIKDNKIVIDKDRFSRLIDGFKENIKESVKGLDDTLDGAKIERALLILKSNAESFKNSDLGGEGNKEFEETINALVRVADEYPAEKQKDADGAKRYGELALERSINLARENGKEVTRAGLMKKFVELYPDSDLSTGYRYELNRMEKVDFKDSSGVVNVDNRFWTISLVELKRPKKLSNAEFGLSGLPQGNIIVKDKELKEVKELGEGDGTIDSIRLDKITDEENVQITVNCKSIDKDGKESVKSSGGINLKRDADASKVCEKSYIKLRNVNIEDNARIRLIPISQGTRTESNFSVFVGIEKRAIKLSTSKTEELIENLNKSIKKWENIVNKLGKVVSGLKAACFATSAVLTVKNFLTGIGGEALARQKVMQSWTIKCNELVNRGEYVNLNACYLAKANEINRDVDIAKGAISDINTRVEGIEKNFVQEGSGILEQDYIDRSKAAVAYCEELKRKYNGRDIGGKKIEELLGDCNNGYNKQGLYGYEELREIEYNLIMSEKGASENIRINSESILKSASERISENKQRAEQLEKDKSAEKLGEPQTIFVPYADRSNLVGQVVSKEGLKNEGIKGKIGSNYVAKVNVAETKKVIINGKEKEGFDAGTYYLGLEKSEGVYSVKDIVRSNGDSLVDDEKSRFIDIYKIGTVTPTESLSLNNPYKNPEVRYYEREPYKGMPAIVPFDVREGWYAATRQTLPAFGGIGAFDVSGRVTSFHLCNVGKDGREQFLEGLGDDICQLINLNTGQPFGVFPGLNEGEARRRVGQAVQALTDAANQYGKRIVRINGRDFNVGNPAANIPSVQCQNFMSPEECHLLFNVCDPVICPSSRCDFGGKYPVADVVQTGIIGSTLLCLPNIKEGIYIPVCLSGIHAGIEGFLSILKSHRDCLQESLETGKTIGICDQIYSIYLCEFFWRQVAPVAKVILPKIVEFAYGQGTRGGGEYLTVQAAWQNTQDSIKYFTQSYAVNSLNSFKARSIEEVGTPFCKAFVSAKGPKSIKSLIEPDSPPQFHAWFSATRYSDVTVPATSQYKVFYHIFAGKDSGVQYSVFLKNPPESGYYDIPAVIHVASGFVGRGQYAQESKDFTAPEGYQELCVRVNDQEECGFKQVSTSFAVNYLRDKYVESEALQKNIRSERECISGSPNLGVALQPNIQAGAEEAGLPQVYNRGIVRICASQNPGSQTEPTRFLEVGQCDDTKIKCWLDMKSVDNAITNNNAGVRNATLSELEKRQQADLAQKGIIIGDDGANAELNILEEEVRKLNKKDISKDDKRFEETETRLKLLFDKVVLNHHKANVLYLIGDLKAIKLGKVVKPQKAKESEIAASSVGIPRAGTISSGSGKNLELQSIRLERDYEINDNNKDYLFDSIANKKTRIYIASDKVYFDFSDATSDDIQVGEIINYHIDLDHNKFISVYEENYDDVDIALGKTYFDILNGGFIIRDKIYNEKKEEISKGFELEQSYDASKRIYLNLNGDKTGIYFEQNKVYIQRGVPDFIYPDESIGVVSDAEIRLISNKKESVNEYLEGDYFDKLHGAKIEGRKVNEIKKAVLENKFENCNMIGNMILGNNKLSISKDNPTEINTGVLTRLSMTGSPSCSGVKIRIRVYDNDNPSKEMKSYDSNFNIYGEDINPASILDFDIKFEKEKTYFVRVYCPAEVEDGNKCSGTGDEGFWIGYFKIK